MRNYYILCVDDEKSILDNLEEQLGRSINATIELAESGEEALEIMQDLERDGHELALIISDQLMPGMKGDQLLQRVHQKYPDALKILLTGQASLEAVRNAVNTSKLYRYISKPWDMTDLVLTVKEALKSYEDQKTLQKQNQQLAESVKLLEKWNKDLEETVYYRTAAIQNLLDNAGQGFVSFGSDLRVHPEFSSECLMIFGDDISGKDWIELLNRVDGEKDREIVREIFETDHFVQKSVYLSLLPSEWITNDLIYRLEYKLVMRDTEMAMMVMITNITEQKRLEQKIKNESNVLRMIVSIIQQKSNFLQSVREFQSFYREELSELFASVADPNLLKEILFRRIHTFKGLFGQYGLNQTMRQLHELESIIGFFRPDVQTVRSFAQQLQGIAWEDVMCEDRAVIEKILGKGFFEEKRQIVLDFERFENLQNRLIERMPAPDKDCLRKSFNQLKHRAFYELLQVYPRFVANLSERFDKSIRPFQVEGGTFTADLDRFRDFCNSLMHVFRNIVDHGIESREHRIDIGKNELGTVFCRIIDPLEGSNEMILEIGDDGQGIDIDRLREKAIQMGRFSELELLTWTQSQLLELIFLDGISTKEQVTIMSGRGVGMAVVKEETEKLGGQIEIESEFGAGTIFRWRLPVLDPKLFELTKCITV